MCSIYEITSENLFERFSISVLSNHFFWTNHFLYNLYSLQFWSNSIIIVDQVIDVICQFFCWCQIYVWFHEIHNQIIQTGFVIFDAGKISAFSSQAYSETCQTSKMNGFTGVISKDAQTYFWNIFVQTPEDFKNWSGHSSTLWMKMLTVVHYHIWGQCSIEMETNLQVNLNPLMFNA